MSYLGSQYINTQHQQPQQQQSAVEDDSNTSTYLKYGLISAGVAVGGFLLYKIFSKKSDEPSPANQPEQPTPTTEKSSTTTAAATQPTPTKQTATTTSSSSTAAVAANTTKASTAAATTTTTTTTTPTPTTKKSTVSTVGWVKYKDELIEFMHPSSFTPQTTTHPMTGLPMIMLNQGEDYQLFMALQPSQMIPGSLVDFVQESFVPLSQMTGMKLAPIKERQINGYSAVTCDMTQVEGTARLHSISIMNSVVLAVIQMIQPNPPGFEQNVETVDKIVQSIVFPEEL